MSALLVALLVAAGFGTWVYTKFQHNTGGNSQSALIGAGISALIAFLVVFTIGHAVLPH